LFNFGDDVLISTLITTVVTPENIIKLKHYMHKGLSIYQASTIRPHLWRCLSW